MREKNYIMTLHSARDMSWSLDWLTDTLYFKDYTLKIII